MERGLNIMPALYTPAGQQFKKQKPAPHFGGTGFTLQIKPD
jgi:hypothetical protein